MSSTESWQKLRLHKKFRNFKSIQKLMENTTKLEENLSGQTTGGNLDFQASGYMDNDLSFYSDSDNDPMGNSTRMTTSRGNVTGPVIDQFYYQHMFNFVVVFILLLQVLLIWTFIYSRLTKYNARIRSLQREQERSRYIRRDPIDVRPPVRLEELLEPRWRPRGEEEGEEEEEQPQQVPMVQFRCGRSG